MTTASASTTYPFAYTTFTNASPAPFTTPTAYPSIFPWGPIPSFACSAPSSAPSSSPQGPLALPKSSSGSCTISNIEGVNDHSFWDMYECCKKGKMSVVGDPLPCAAVCYTNDQESFLEVGECLSKRVKEVVCSPPEAQRGDGKSQNSTSSAVESSSKAAPSKTAEVSGVTGTKTPSPTPAPTEANSAAGKVGAGQGAVSKAGLVVFGFLAVTSAVGMLM